MKALITLFILAGQLGSQAGTGTGSLPEIARQIRARRTVTEAQGPVFTNENIGQVRATLATADGPAPIVKAPVEESETLPGGRDEAAWRALFAEARVTITRAEDRARLTEQELQTLNRRLLTESSLYNREGQLTPLIVEKQAELETARESVVLANDALQNLREELRRSGGPAGWAR